MLPNIDDILDIGIKHIYTKYSQLNPRERVVLLENISAGQDKIIQTFSLESNFSSKRLFLPVYWHFMQNYAEVLQSEKIGKEYLLFVKLKKTLPYWKDFKREILSQKWVRPYLESNLKQLYL